MKWDKAFLNFPPSGAQEGPDAGAGGVQRCFVPMLLQGGCGYEDFDFSPFARNAIGFETLFDRLYERAHENNETYPPYDIVRKGEDAFQINLALAGFAPEDITLTTEASQLTVAGRKPENNQTEYLYQGISARAFQRRFNLADYIEVENASFENGLLHINLVRRMPERLKPRRIDIGTVSKLETKGTGKAA